ncbi:hypothetical protein TPAR_08904, partial [Tolypocladium paradoxum]
STSASAYRLKFDIEYTDGGPIITYKPHEIVIDNPRGAEHRRMYVFVTSPIIMSFPFECPMREIPDLESEMLNSILLPVNRLQIRTSATTLGPVAGQAGPEHGYVPVLPRMGTSAALRPTSRRWRPRRGTGTLPWCRVRLDGWRGPHTQTVLSYNPSPSSLGTKTRRRQAVFRGARQRMRNRKGICLLPRKIWVHEAGRMTAPPLSRTTESQVPAVVDSDLVAHLSSGPALRPGTPQRAWPTSPGSPSLCRGLSVPPRARHSRYATGMPPAYLSLPGP